ncbi:hypothetical protein KEJ50_05845 [Candidatus Bathyarchaeota archaeon]|nr:hypothetical protein [Candidatus Bathyarchaeota archaeon]
MLKFKFLRILVLTIALASLILNGSMVKAQVGVPKLVVSSVYWGVNPAIPLTASPGDKGATLSIIVVNAGDDFARDVKGTLMLQSPFTCEYYSNSEKHLIDSVTKVAGDIAAGRSFTFQYTLNIVQNASEGVYKLLFKLTYRSARMLSETTETIYVDVPIWKGELHIQSVSTNPPKVYPGNMQVALTVFIINSGLGSVNNLKVFLELNEPFKASSTGSNEAFIGTIRSSQVAQARFLIDINEKAKPGNYPLSLYAFEESNKYLIGLISFTIAEKASFTIIEAKPTSFQAGDLGVAFKITLKNNGSVKAESVRVKLLAGNYFSGTLTDFLGTINPGESKTAFFLVDIDGKTPPNSYTVDLRIEWIQDEFYNLNDNLPIVINVKWRYSMVIIAVVLAIAAIAVLSFIIKRKGFSFKKSS